MNTVSSKIHKEDSAPTTHKVASVAHDAIDGASKKAEPLEQQLREQAAKASEQLREQAGKAGEQLEATQAAAVKQVEDSIQKIERFVRERPVAATGLAFAAGALAAMILRR